LDNARTWFYLAPYTCVYHNHLLSACGWTHLPARNGAWFFCTAAATRVLVGQLLPRHPPPTVLSRHITGPVLDNASDTAFALSLNAIANDLRRLEHHHLDKRRRLERTERNPRQQRGCWFVSPRLDATLWRFARNTRRLSAADRYLVAETP